MNVRSTPTILASLLLVALIALTGAQALLSERFFPGATLVSAPVLTSTALQIVSGIVFAATLLVLGRVAGVRWLIAVLVTGAAMRTLFLASHPILETDFNRYLWDGAVVVSHENPWRHAPQNVMDGNASPSLTRLGEQAGITLQRVNHPELTSIYPFGAQLMFALSAVIDRFDLTVWRVLLLVSECAALAILLKTLATMKLPGLWIACWWINPLFVREATNTAHMDALLLPWISAVLYAVVTQRRRLLLLMAGVATSIKLWPALLCFWGFQDSAPARWIKAFILTGLLVVICVLPMLLTDRSDGSGLIAYSGRWDTNGGVFSLLRDGWSLIAGSESAQLFARVCVVIAFAAVLLSATRQSHEPALVQLQKISTVLLALFLLSPAGYPWYALWLAPIAVLVPRWSFVAMTAVLPLYYVRFFLQSRGVFWPFDHVIPVAEAALILLVVWLERSGRLMPPFAGGSPHGNHGGIR